MKLFLILLIFCLPAFAKENKTKQELNRFIASESEGSGVSSCKSSFYGKGKQTVVYNEEMSKIVFKVNSFGDCATAVIPFLNDFSRVRPSQTVFGLANSEGGKIIRS